MEYSCGKPLSQQTRLIKRMLWLLGMKKQTEKKMLENGFNERPDPVPKPLLRGLQITETAHRGRSVWRIESGVGGAKGRDENSESRRAIDAGGTGGSGRTGGADTVILFLHGGAYMANITSAHWSLAGKLVQKTGALVYVPDYPLAPRSTWKATYAFTEAFYRELGARHQGARFILMGDSAGGGLALSLAEQLRGAGLPPPAEIVLFSPWLDLSLENPAIAALDPLDCILSAKGLAGAAQQYADGLDLKDPRISPLYGDCSGLPRISIFTGTHDLLYADARKFRDMLQGKAVPLDFYEYPELFHDWVIFTMLKESADVLERAVHIIGGV